MLALSTGAGVILLILGGVFVVAAGGGLLLRSRTRRSGVEIPRAMRPGPSDQALETPLLQKLQGWGVLLTAFFVLWIPYNWVTEPDRNLTQEQSLKTDAISRGERAVLPYSEENQLGIGCTRCHGPELKGGTVIQRGVDPVTGAVLVGTPANLSTVCGGPFFPGHMQIWDVSDITGTIVNGRPDAGMPSWSIREAGALDDQQINDLVNYLVWYSSKNVPFSENICLNPEAQKLAVSKFTPPTTLYSYQHVIKPLVDAAAAAAAKASASPGAPAPSTSASAAPVPSASSSPAAGSGS